MAKASLTNAVAPSSLYPFAYPTPNAAKWATNWATKRTYAHFATNFGGKAEGVNG